ncbi:MAG: type I methionyl aminopeptidase [Firmicutes bacterium]|nr:type I methionyl aminopeptidase [Bacillota bacterium]
MIIKTEEELRHMQEIGRICALVLKKMAAAVKPGVTTKELDEYGGELFKAYGAKSAPIACYNFPGHNCISVNNTVAHGIPSQDIVIREGDIVNIDVSAEKDGFFGDNSGSFPVGHVKHTYEKLMTAGREALAQAIAAASAGYRLNGVGLAAEKCARRHGYRIIRNLCGHGVGHTLHDDPDCVYMYHEKKDRRIMPPGLVIAIEPFVSLGDEYVEELNDGWTLKTPHRHQVVQYEKTVMIREGEPPLILTPWDEELEDMI